ncbi:MAG: L,D-transpeptidase [Cyanobacteria bacterium RM1_2_2]|nr:L,D-transpeptidase [Cyanobacteria bacterium RM1_2_2]
MPLWLTEHGQAVPLSRAPQPITTAQPSTALSIGSEANLPEHLLSAVDARLKLPSTANFVAQPVLDAANQLVSTSAIPALPGLGHADQFLPAQDAFAPLRLVIKLSERRVYIYKKEQVKTSFPVAIGRSGWETPTGKYTVIQMQHDPIWQHPFTGELVPPGSDNPLGARWIGFWTDGTNYIGFHGTPNEASVGQPASHGCVRMYNRDVIQLFEMVQIGTTVEVVP